MTNFINNIENILIILLPLSIFVERVVEMIKSFIYNFKKEETISKDIKIIISVAISILTCIILEINIDYGFAMAPLASGVLTGVIVSGGSNFIHALLTTVQSIKDKNETITEETELEGLYRKKQIEENFSTIVSINNTENDYEKQLRKDLKKIKSNEAPEPPYIIPMPTPKSKSIKINTTDISKLTEEEKDLLRQYWQNN